MKHGATLTCLVLLALVALTSFAAKAEQIAEQAEKPIWQQEVERTYPQQQPPQQRPAGNFYNPHQDMAPPMNPQAAPQQVNRPYYVDPQAQERRRPTYNATNEPSPTEPTEPQPDYVAPDLKQNPEAAADSDLEVTGSAEEQLKEGEEKTDELPGAPIEQVQPKWAEKTKGSVKVLNKVYTRNKELTIKKGDTAKLGALNIKLEKCFRMPESDKKESSALLLISETFSSQPTKEIFHGWMFSSSPAISALEHPLYDVILLGCEDEEKKEAPTDKKKDKPDSKDPKDVKKNDTKKTDKTKEKPKAAN